jgi:hypothetical protein
MRFVLVGLALVGLVGCAPQASTETRSLSAIDTLAASAVAIRFSPGCGSAVGVTGGQSFQGSMLFESDGDAPAACRVEFDFDVPDGYQLGVPQIIYRGDGNPGTLEAHYTWAGAPDTRDETHTIVVDDAIDGADLPYGDFMIAAGPYETWSPSCNGSQDGGPQRVTLAIDLTLTAPPGGTVMLQVVSGVTPYKLGAPWRRCGEDGALPAPPGAAGEWCGLPHQRGCAPDLVCEYPSGPPRLGTCIDPSQQVPPHPLGEWCGGWRSVACDDGLVCWHRDPAEMEAHQLGKCVLPTSGVDEPCGLGVPALTCDSGLYCFSNHCVEADGSYQSPCGDELPACQAGLQCDRGSCAPAPAGPGEPCGGAMHTHCRYPLACTRAQPDDDSGVCQPR